MNSWPADIETGNDTTDLYLVPGFHHAKLLIKGCTQIFLYLSPLRVEPMSRMRIWVQGPAFGRDFELIIEISVLSKAQSKNAKWLAHSAFASILSRAGTPPWALRLVFEMAF